MPEVDLSAYSKGDYQPGRGIMARTLWFFLDALVLQARWLPGSRVRRGLLRAFGARIGRRVVFRPRLHVKYPWRLEIGDNTWVGEGVWIDNLENVTIGPNACISQEAYLLTGNHDYSRVDFRLLTRPIVIERGAWVGARAVVCPGVKVATHSVIAVGSVVVSDTTAHGVYQGNPAILKRQRTIREQPDVSRNEATE